MRSFRFSITKHARFGTGQLRFDTMLLESTVETPMIISFWARPFGITLQSFFNLAGSVIQVIQFLMCSYSIVTIPQVYLNMMLVII